MTDDEPDPDDDDVLENLGDLVQRTGDDGTFRFVNRAWREALGHDPRRVGLFDVLHLDHHRRWREAVEALAEAPEPRRLDAVLRTLDGRELEVEGTLTGARRGGRLTAVDAVFRDVTERRAVPRQEQEFVSIVSHELRTPLTSILGSLDLVARGELADRPERMAKALEVATRNSRRLLQLINDLLDLQKLTAGKMVFRLEPLPVAPVLREALEDMEGLAGSQRVTLSLDPPDGQVVRADHHRLIQVLQNLLSNAIKFSPPGADVVVGAETRGAAVRLWVRDSGPGIPDEARPRIFEPFRQLDGSRTRPADGSGLGLAIALRLVEGMEGRLDFTSRPGHGATFWVELAATRARPESPRPHRGLSRRRR